MADMYKSRTGKEYYASARRESNSRRMQRVERAIYLNATGKYIVRNRTSSFGTFDDLEQARKVRDEKIPVRVRGVRRYK